MNDHELIN